MKQLSVTLDSFRSHAYQDVEIIVVDDGSTDETEEILGRHVDLVQAIYTRRQGSFFLNGSGPMNLGHSHARSDVVLEQGGEVVHVNDCVSPMVDACRQGIVAIARVFHGTPSELDRLLEDQRTGMLEVVEDVEVADVCCDWSRGAVPRVGRHNVRLYTGKERQAPLLFLGAVHRLDWEAIGGYDETLGTRNRNNDGDLAKRLMERGVRFRFLGNAIAFHQEHPKI